MEEFLDFRLIILLEIVSFQELRLFREILKNFKIMLLNNNSNSSRRII
jgi:hypothetical protein